MILSETIEQNKRLGRSIYRLRRSTGISQRFIEDKMGKYASWMSQVEAGRVTVCAEDLRRVAKILGVTVDTFFLPDYYTERVNEGG